MYIWSVFLIIEHIQDRGATLSTCKRVHPDAAPKPRTAFDCIARLRNEECFSDTELVKPDSNFNNRLASKAATLIF